MIIQDIKKVIHDNIREYGMYIALAVIMAIFTIATKGDFISSQNIANLINQTGYIAVLAVGMTMVIVIRHIDLSVGFLAGFLGAVAAIALKNWGMSSLLAIPLVLVIGTIAGLIMAFPIASLGIPSFVASLAGWLIYRGILLLVTSDTGTIIIDDPFFIAISNGFIPDIFTSAKFLPGVHKLTLIIGALAILWSIMSSIKVRNNKKAYNFEVMPLNIFILKQIFITIILSYITWILAGYNGLSWTIVIMLGVVLFFDWFTQKTALGRHIYAVGGNPDAAELSGISVKRITVFVFGAMGFLSALSGIMFASRLQSATPTAGTLFELDAVAAAYIGGVSAAGGIGKISGSLIGALVYMSLRNGMDLMFVDASLQYIIRGGVLVLAVVFDVATRNVKR